MSSISRCSIILCFLVMSAPPAKAQEIVPPSPKEIAPIAPSDAVTEKAGKVVLQGLNKITARTSELTIKTGGYAQFGDLWIRNVTCWTSPPDQKPESAVLLDIIERTPGAGISLV